MAVAEQAAGIVVGCMPVMPSFFRHFFGQAHVPAQYGPNGRAKKLRYANFSIGGGSGNSRHKSGGKDPYMIETLDTNTDNELSNLEAGSSYNPKNERTVTVTGNPFSSSLDTLRETQEVPDNTALVSKSFQVESHPRGIKGSAASATDSR